MTNQLPETCSFREFADILHCRPSWVTALRKAGRLVLTDDSKSVKTRESLQLVEDTKDPAKAAIAARHAAERENVADNAAGEEDASTVQQTSEFQLHRSKREEFAAKREQLNFERESGKLLDAAAVESGLADASTNFRKTAESWADSWAPQLVGKNEQQIHDFVTAEVGHALTELAREFHQLAKVGTA